MGVKFVKGNAPWNKGKKGVYSVASRKKMSDSQLRNSHRGPKHPEWKGGSWVYWQSEIKKRDHYTCLVCHLYDPDIVEAAHIKPIVGLLNRRTAGHPLNSYENLITLCPNCHARYDKNIIDI